MSILPKDEKFEVEPHIANGLLTGQLVKINDVLYIVRHITLKQGGYEKVLVAARVPELELNRLEV